ncbi:ABC transporter ATP-binding protein [Eubacterium multiforme]|uniref:ABC-2 type transport system ATP-binding protein n=1 Tax=Eubacterium multiforme TaxID=83339 RepID=A0ABT9UVJ9_9FIRM|nr:ABC transporter ATP-binding protein [Eubacterium multiforme]MDQ0150338.1 ABC-2 type transport system ATP-binding protein [Eubacterium multiforme]
MNVLEVRNLKKVIGKREIIKDLNFTVKPGEIYGFLGPNGAGKTTTIRMLVGLIAPTSGEVLICGENLQNNKEKALKDVGAVVENPELYKYLSGRENLMQIARIRKVSKDEINKLIKLVGLENRIDDKVKKYSLGMKQRLGLAAALIGNPKLLILDEPTNGLDPSGIIDFRNIVKKASRERGMAVLVSSHILSEVQQLCDRVAFINDGVIKATEDMGEAIQGTNKESLTLVARDKEDKVIKVLRNQPFVVTAEGNKDGINVVVHVGMTPELIKALVKEDILIEEIYKNREGLEQRYMELVEGGIR